MAKFTKVSESGQIEIDFEAMAQEVCPEFVKEVSNALRNPNSVIISEDCEALVYKEIIVNDGFYVYIIQANKGLGKDSWKVSKTIMSKYDIKDLYDKLYGGETK